MIRRLTFQTGGRITEATIEEQAGLLVDEAATRTTRIGVRDKVRTRFHYPAIDRSIVALKYLDRRECLEVCMA
jgi:hypothetical protein